MPRFWVAFFLLPFCFTFAFGQASEYNAIYAGKEGKVFSRKPNAFLVEVTRSRKPGRALDVGTGQGRNALYLAEHGWDVTGFDAADEDVRQARTKAARLGLHIAAFVTTFEKFDFGENQWDLIVMTYVPTRAVAPKVTRSLKPGGAVVIEDRHSDTRKVWPDGGLFADNELLFLFPALRVLRYEDVWARADWQAQGIHERLVRMLAEKPSPQEPGCLWKGKPVSEGGVVCWDHAVRFRCEDGGWIFTHENCN
jgi:SAM-dependent methyltransferase